MVKPGPGNYEVKDLAFIKRKDFHKPFKSAFGTSDSRKINALNETLSPGPGAYTEGNYQNKN